uniref:Putative secreted protein n=1 Tax=Ixodes ricinus TaxID=34613 RepID=A0A0K8RA66_IXORI
MNEFQMISEVLYHIPEANVYASTPEEAKSRRLCGIETYKVFPDSAELALRMIISGKNQSIYKVSPYQSDMNAICPTQISLPDQYGLMRVLLSDFKNCYVLKKVNNKNEGPFCELFVKNNTNPITHLDECWLVFLAFCGYPKAIYNETSCYSK